MDRDGVLLNDFKQKLVEYFIELFDRIDEPEDTLFVAVTRKGYWLYENVRTQLEELRPDYKDIEVYSDRRLLKDFHFDLIKDKKIFLFDDTVNNGNNLFFFFVLLLKHDAKKVFPVVYAMSTEYLAHCELNFSIHQKSKYFEYERVYKKEAEVGGVPQKLWLEAEEIYQLFNHSLKYEKIMTASEVSVFSIRQLFLAQDCLSPFAMDLPILRSEMRSQSGCHSVFFTKAEWDLLSNRSGNWEYVSNAYNELGKEINCDYFKLYDRFLEEQFEDTFWDFVVKCKHKEENDGVKAIFVPFALVKSFSYQDAWQCFVHMYQGTEYFEYILQMLTLEKTGEDLYSKADTLIRSNHNFGRAIIRSVIYYISMYIGGMFKQMVQSVLGKELILDTSMMEHHNVKQFNNTVKNMWESFNKDKFAQILLCCGKTETVKPINYKMNENTEKAFGNFNAINRYIHFRVIESKYLDVSMKEKILTIETIEKEVDSKFAFNSMSERKAAITKSILLLLEISCVGNEILLDNKTGVIYRGFRAGETSEILFKKSFFWVYAYVNTLYYLAGEKKYKEKIFRFMDFVEKIFNVNEYWEKLVTKEEFEMYKQYLVTMKNPHEQIPSKNYMFDFCVKGEENYGNRVFIQRVESDVKEWLQQEKREHENEICSK